MPSAHPLRVRRPAARVAFAVLSLAACGGAQAAVCRVTPDGAALADGSDWNAQAMQLHAALADARCSDIWVRHGLYRTVRAAGATPTDAEIDVHFAIDRVLALRGGFAGDESDVDQRRPGTPSILSGDIGADDLDADGNAIAERHTDVVGPNAAHVLVIGGLAQLGNGVYGADTVVEGFTITAGGRRTLGMTRGAALYCNGAGGGRECSPTLTRLVLSGHRAMYGGALYIEASYEGRSEAVLREVAFVGNYADSFGGAMHSDGSAESTPPFPGPGWASPRLHHVTFSDNDAAGPGASIGLEWHGAPLLEDVTIAQTSRVAPMLVANAMVTMRRSIVWSSAAVADTAPWPNTVVEDSVLRTGCAPMATCARILTTDPQLAPLAADRGWVPTRRLAAGSSARDSAGGACSGLDARGVLRPRGTACDAGAVEFSAGTLVLEAGTPDAPEGDDGTRDAALVFRVSDADAMPVDALLRFTIEAAPGSAGTPDDWFAPHVDAAVQADGRIDVPLQAIADGTVEPDETFLLQATGQPLTLGLAPELADGLALTLRNDDAATLVFAVAAAAEGSGTLSLRGTLDHAVQGGVALDIATRDIDATASVDYVPHAARIEHDGSTLTPVAVDIALLDDAAFEPHETFALEGSGATCTFEPCPVTVQAGATILDDEAPSQGIAVWVDNGGDGTIDPGLPTEYRVTVRNRGPGAALGIAVVEAGTAPLLDTLWSCAAPGESACIESTGIDALSAHVDLAEGTEATVTVSALADHFDPTLDYRVTLTAPAGYTDLDASDDSAIDSDVRRTIFRDGIERGD